MPQFALLFYMQLYLLLVMALLPSTLAQSSCEMIFSNGYQEITSGTCAGLGQGWGDITRADECDNAGNSYLGIGSSSTNSGPPGCQLWNGQSIYFNSNTASSTAPTSSLSSICTLDGRVVTVDSDGSTIFPASVKALSRIEVLPGVLVLACVCFRQMRYDFLVN